jgi:hypothetical protein
MKMIKSKWSAFFSIVFDPWILLAFSATAVLFYLLLNQSDRLLIALLTVLVSIASGIIGGIVTKKWDEVTGEAVLVARGKAAIRSLKLLLANTVSLERRVRLYLSRYNRARKDRAKSDLVPTYLEDVIERCGILEEEVLSSIENWTDIIPEADVRTQIGLISDLKIRVDVLSQEAKALASELVESKGRSEKEIEALKVEKAQKGAELAKARRELAGRTLDIGAPLSSGSYQPGGGSIIVSPSSFSYPHFEPSLIGPSAVTVRPSTGIPYLDQPIIPSVKKKSGEPES